MLDCQQLSALRTELKTHLYTDAKSVCDWLNTAFGIEYTPQGVADLLNRIGFTYKKTKEVPCEADADQERINAQATKELYQSALEKHPQATCVYIISDNARYYKYAYLCVFDNNNWTPIYWGKINKRIASFSKMGKNIVYLPVIYSNNRMHPIGSAFLLNEQWEVKPIKYNKIQKESITINRKFPLLKHIYDINLTN